MCIYIFSVTEKYKSLKACLHGGRGPQIHEVTCGGSPHLSYKCDQIKMRDYMDRRVTSPKQVTSRTWGPPPPCKQPLMFVLMHVSTEETLRSLSKLLPSISSEHLCFCVPLICLHWHHSSAKKLDTQMNTGEYNSLDIQTGFRKKTSTFLVIFLPFYVVYCILFTDTTVFQPWRYKNAGEWLTTQSHN